MSAGDLARALLALGDHLRLVGYATYGRRGSAISVAEAVAHELAHYLLAGPDFEHELREMSARASDRHEASAIRVEIAALRRLGLEIPLRTLWGRSNWRADPPPRISAPGRRSDDEDDPAGVYRGPDWIPSRAVTSRSISS